MCDPDALFDESNLLPGVVDLVKFDSVGNRALGVIDSDVHARLASGCWPDSTEWDWLPAGFHRKVSGNVMLFNPPPPS